MNANGSNNELGEGKRTEWGFSLPGEKDLVSTELVTHTKSCATCLGAISNIVSPFFFLIEKI